MIGLALALGSGLAFAGLDAVRKFLLIQLDSWTLLFLLSAGQLLPYAGWWWVSSEPAVRHSVHAYLPWLAGVTGLQLGANLLFLAALQRGELSRVVPFLSLTPVLTAVAGYLTLGQAPGPWVWLGVCLVTAGAMGLAVVRSGGRSRPALDGPSLMSIAVAALWSLGTAADAQALQEVSAPTHAVCQSASIALCTGLLLRARRQRVAPHAFRGRVGGWMAGAILLGSAALGLQLAALTETWVSLVETVKRASGAVCSLLVGRIGFQEQITPGRVLGVSLVILGTALILLAPAIGSDWTEPPARRSVHPP